ncbi:protein-export chaperone SecB [Labrys wisconsinensis]|uniref:Protein-export protein SecB n=1 Tax=Labrys wisconsinensis TaxID=425677 RepID=A0ABU0J1D8_9HYPH|nr:protein-export chaperone SecB [Labrys wisconsinensis]MDQ0468068.1 preprotein translocase subunit SecB [Labrys wisconsinensis]
MATGPQPTNGNGDTRKEVQQSINVLAQYIKDLSFENPNAPRSLGTQQGSPQITLTVNVNGRPLSPTDFEVELSIEGGAGEGAGTLFKFELVYGSVVRLAGISPDDAHAVIMIEGPRLMFPFARQIIADATRNGGFPPLMIDPIDFVALYRNRMAQLQQQPSGQA